MSLFEVPVLILVDEMIGYIKEIGIGDKAVTILFSVLAGLLFHSMIARSRALATAARALSKPAAIILKLLTNAIRAARGEEDDGKCDETPPDGPVESERDAWYICGSSVRYGPLCISTYAKEISVDGVSLVPELSRRERRLIIGTTKKLMQELKAVHKAKDLRDALLALNPPKEPGGSFTAGNTYEVNETEDSEPPPADEVDAGPIIHDEASEDQQEVERLAKALRVNRWSEAPLVHMQPKAALPGPSAKAQSDPSQLASGFDADGNLIYFNSETGDIVQICPANNYQLAEFQS